MLFVPIDAQTSLSYTGITSIGRRDWINGVAVTGSGEPGTEGGRFAVGALFFHAGNDVRTCARIGMDGNTSVVVPGEYAVGFSRDRVGDGRLALHGLFHGGNKAFCA